MDERKKPDADLRKYYTVFLEFALLLVLIVFLVATKLELRPAEQDLDLTEEQEVVQMEDIIQTKQEERPPTPPKPQVPVEVPNDEIIEDDEILFDSEFNIDDPLEMPPPPDEEEDEEDFFVAVEQMPSLIGGQVELQRCVEYPSRARKAGIEGRVIVQFIVNEEGNVEDPRVIRGIGGGADEEALRCVKEAEFEPGRQRGEPVRVQYSLPVIYRLQN